jgi:hypothetical protein
MREAPMRDVTREIAFSRHEGSRGVEWLRTSYRLFRRAKVAWLVLFLLYGFVLGAIKLVPFIGGLAWVIMKPVFAVGFLAGAWNEERGGTPAPRHLFQGFRSNLWALLPLGVVLLVGIVLAVAATAVVDGGQLIGLLLDPVPLQLDPEAAQRRVAEALAEPRVQWGMAFGALCAMPTILALWWAPALVVFQDASPGVALRTSLRAALANWRPLIRYGVVMFFFAAVVPSFLSFLMAAIFPESLALVVPGLILFAYELCCLAVLQIADYVSYRDVFHANETLAPIERTGKSAAKPGSVDG